MLTVVDPATARLIEATRSASAAGEHARAIDLAREAVAAGSASGDVAGQAVALREMADLHSHSGQFEQVITACEIGLDLVRELGDERSTCRLLTTRSYALSELGLCEEALDGLNVAWEIADRLEDSGLQYWVRNRLGVVNSTLGRFADAHLQLTSALGLAQELSDETRFSALNNLADLGMSRAQELRTGDDPASVEALVAESLGYASGALDLARSLAHPYKIAIALGNLGVLRWLAGDSAAALQLLADARSLAAERGYRSLELSDLQYTAPILLAQGDATAAVDVLEFVLERWQASDERFVERDCLLLLSQAHAAAGDFRTALRYHREFYALEQRIRSERVEVRAHLVARRMELETARSDAADAHARNKQLEEDTASLQIRTVELERRVHQDSLTGLGNRRYLDAVLPQLFRDSPAHGRGLYVAMLDLDHFKAVNDTFGHAVGDQVLQRVAVLIRRSSRVSDLVARYGGEEFLLGFTHVDGPLAAAMCDGLREAIAAEPWSTVRPGLAVTVSIGLAARSDSDSLTQLVQHADEYLYLAKAAGRNRVQSAPAGERLPPPLALLSPDG